MAARTPNQDKALRWYCEEHDLKPQLSTHPVYYFVDKSGQEVKNDIIHIHNDWLEWKAENKKKAPA